GKASRGSPPRRRTVCTVMPWAAEAVQDYVVNIRPRYGFAGRPALWLTERGGRLRPRQIEERFAAYRDALKLPAELVPHCLAERGLGRDDIAAAIARAAPSRAQQRRLAAALSADPGLLTSGRPEGPPQVELLIRALQEIGARRLALPRCAHCDQPSRLVQRDG